MPRQLLGTGHPAAGQEQLLQIQAALLRQAHNGLDLSGRGQA
jgi:hypothetical protein